MSEKKKYTRDAVDEYFIQQFNNIKGVKRGPGYKNWNKKSVLMAQQFLKTQPSGRLDKKKQEVVWDSPLVWGVKFDRIVVKNELIPHFSHFTLKNGADVVFFELDLSSLILKDENMRSKLKNLSKITSSLSMHNNTLKIGSDSISSTLISLYSTMKYLLGHQSIHKVMENYPKFMFSISNEDTLKDIPKSKKPFTDAVIISLSKMVKENASNVHTYDEETMESQLVIPGLTDKLYSFKVHMKGKKPRMNVNSNLKRKIKLNEYEDNNLDKGEGESSDEEEESFDFKEQSDSDSD